jgi:hypothetical protein
LEKSMTVQDRIATGQVKLDTVRIREETRLIKLARSAGYFDHRALSTDVTAMFKAFVETLPVKDSQLNRLEKEVKSMAARESVQDRKDDTRRKILLGSFLIAQFEHKPELLGSMQDEISQFLDQHKDKTAAAVNKQLLKQWIGE